MEIRIDLDRCQGHGRCLESAPDVFGYDDITNQAVVLRGATFDVNPQGVQQAAVGCPELAISLIDGIGRPD